MPTSDYGGQGAPRNNEGEFTLKYTKTTPKLGRREREKIFYRYDEAKAFYDSIDDSAAIWDTTRYAELCEAKSRIAHYAAILQHKKEKSRTRQVVQETSDLEHAIAKITRGTKGTDWNLVKESCHEITEAEFLKLKAESET